MMEYRTIIAEHSTTLDERVNELMAEGWKPLGGVSVSIASEDPLLTVQYIYAQAMVKQESKKSPAIKLSTGEDW